RWIKLLSDYECDLKYHSGKANVVADALSRKERVKPRQVHAMSMTIHSKIKTKILEAQREAAKDLTAPAEWLQGLDTQFEKRGDGGIYFVERIWIPLVGGIRKLIMDEAHTSKLSKSAHFIAIREDFKIESWDTHLSLVEFYYNNIYHKSIKCAPFEALYRRKCRSLMIWAEVGESQLIRPEIVQETKEKIMQIKERLKMTRDRQKSYADKRRKPLEFKVGDHVLLKVSPWKGVKCLADSDLQVPLEEIKVDDKLYFMEEPIEIVDRQVKKLKRSWILIVKVKENQEKDKIRSKPDKKGKRGEAGRSLKHLQWVEEEKLNKMQKEGPKMQKPYKL
nr:hypothetical protein [Tanacetum cinerariifolium]